MDARRTGHGGLQGRSEEILCLGILNHALVAFSVLVLKQSKMNSNEINSLPL
jgi:hypothetical protein